MTTTFLLAMTTPMIVLPIERIFKPARQNKQVADDRGIAPELAKAVAHVLGPERLFGDDPSVALSRWSYVPDVAPFNVAEPWPQDLLKSLARPDVLDRAHRTCASRVLRDLRNALAHGSFAYLDDRGRYSGGRAAMLAFASVSDREGRLVGLNVLRVAEQNCLCFLTAWAEWLAQPALRETLDRLDPLAA